MSYTKQPQQLPDVHGDKVKWFPRLCEAAAQDVWEKKKQNKTQEGKWNFTRSLQGHQNPLPQEPYSPAASTFRLLTISFAHKLSYSPPTFLDIFIPFLLHTVSTFCPQKNTVFEKGFSSKYRQLVMQGQCNTEKDVLNHDLANQIEA